MFGVCTGWETAPDPERIGTRTGSGHQPLRQQEYCKRRRCLAQFGWVLEALLC
jgi:hypothetical protein